MRRVKMARAKRRQVLGRYNFEGWLPSPPRGKIDA